MKKLYPPFAPGLLVLPAVACCVLGALSFPAACRADAGRLAADCRIPRLGYFAIHATHPSTGALPVALASPASGLFLKRSERAGRDYYLKFRRETPADTAAVETGEEPPAHHEEYYLEFEPAFPAQADEAGARAESEPDTADYYLDFGSEDTPDSLSGEPDVMEIEIDDEGVRIEPAGKRNRLSVSVGGWDDPENHIVDSEDFDGRRGRFDWGLGLSYQRVDGLSWILKQDLTHSDWRIPTINLREIYSSKQSRWLYDVGIEQIIVPPLPLYVGASVYEVTDSNPIDREIIESSENSLAAFLLNGDYRDYFTREGVSLRAGVEIPSAGTVEFEYRDDGYGSLEKKTDWSLFGGDESFRPNPPIDDGDMKSYVISYTLDHRRGVTCITKGAWIRLYMEKAGYGLGGDFEFTTLFLDARNYVKLNPCQAIRYRLMAGSRTDGHLPMQREFYVGGIGTLRGHDYKELTGDQVILGNIEYSPYVDDDLGVFLFIDSGKAWYGDGGFSEQRLELDVGIGIELPCQQTNLYFAKDLKDDDSPILVGLRLNRTF